MNKFTTLFLIVLSSLFFSCQTDSLENIQDKQSLVNPNEQNQACIEGFAGEYPCKNIDLKARLSPGSLMGERLNDIWGWTDPLTGKEYALVGLTDGVTFVDISRPGEPVVVGKLAESVDSLNLKTAGILHHHEKSAWRDMKVYKNHIFVVSDNQIHGLQVFDLTRIRDAGSEAVDFTEDAHYEQFGRAHNIAINKETGFAYVVGSDTFGGGLHIIDIRTPGKPVFAAAYADTNVGRNSTGYVHDTQCVVYRGPDNQYQGHEICFNSSETHLAIVDVTNKELIFTISRKTYEGRGYTHQGWLTEDHRYFLLDDEFDERNNHHNTRTYIWDVGNLDNPEMMDYYESERKSIDHNQYVKGNRVYQANYTSGLQILSLDDISSGSLQEVAWFDTFPENDTLSFDGAWSNYPFFESGVVIVSDITGGLFILEPAL